MAQMKRCKQCGILKNIDDFRKYAYAKKNNTEGHMSICKGCENMNSTYRRLQHADALDEKGVQDLEKLNSAYDILEARGLHTPRIAVSIRRDKDSLETNVELISRFYADNVVRAAAILVDDVVEVKDIKDVPDDLKYWLDADFSEWAEKGLDPEYLQETVYESLKAKYRPQIGVNKDTFLPIYDDAYKTELNAILRRFDDYEEESAGTMT